MTYEKTYSILSNVWFCAKRCVEQVRFRFYGPALLVVLIDAAMPFLSALLPSTVVGLLTSGAGALKVFTVTAAFAGSLVFFGYLGNVLKLYRDRALLCARVLDTAGLEKEFSFSYAYLETKQAGDDIEKAGKAYYSGAGQGIELAIQAPVEIAGTFLSILLYTAVTAALHPLLVLLLIGCPLLHTLLIVRNIACENRMFDEQNTIEVRKNRLFQEMIRFRNAKDIRTYHAGTWFHRKMKDYGASILRLQARRGRRAFAIQAAGRTLLLIRDVGCYGYLLYRVTHGMELASFVLYISVFAGFSGYFEKLVDGCRNLADTHPIITAFRNFLLEPEHRILTGDRSVPRGPHSFTFENVSFTYPDAEEPVIRDLSFTIHAGEKLALVGPNGAGKTTLIKLLSGLYAPSAGTIRMDGIDIRELDEKSYYRAIGTVFQDDFTIAFPVAENIACVSEEEADAERIWRCLEEAGLAERIRACPKGLHTGLYQTIDPDGILLSGGEMQRLFLARALYKNADTLILDEPTAAMDPLAEARLYANYGSMTANKTSVFISHRLSSTRFCDRILLLENGRIVEEGSHDELLKQNGRYAEIFRVQAHYYQKEEAAL